MPWADIVTPQPLFQNTFILKSPRVANSADLIKIATMIIKTAFKDSKRLNELEIMH